MKQKVDSRDHGYRRIERWLRIAFVLLWVTVIVAALVWLMPLSERIAQR
jgi:hypothetical protein